MTSLRARGRYLYCQLEQSSRRRTTLTSHRERWLWIECREQPRRHWRTCPLPVRARAQHQQQCRQQQRRGVDDPPLPAGVLSLSLPSPLPSPLPMPLPLAAHSPDAPKLSFMLRAQLTAHVHVARHGHASPPKFMTSLFIDFSYAFMTSRRVRPTNHKALRYK